MTRNARKLSTLLLFMSVVLLSGCATSGAKNPNDPWEGYNRAVFKVNDGIDKVIFKPVARVYDAITPAPLDQGITNFFTNIGTVPKIINDLLQFRIRRAWRDIWRLSLNTTVGIGGLVDVAGHAGLPDLPQDFGLTLARWGYQNSNYVVIPFFGPSTLRDSIGSSVDYVIGVWPYIQPERLRWKLFGLNMVDRRGDLLEAEKIMLAASLDKYVFVRDAYLQRRRIQVKQIRGEAVGAEASHGAIPSEADSDKKADDTVGSDFVLPTNLEALTTEGKTADTKTELRKKPESKTVLPQSTQKPSPAKRI